MCEERKRGGGSMRSKGRKPVFLSLPALCAQMPEVITLEKKKDISTSNQFQDAKVSKRGHTLGRNVLILCA